MSTTVDLDVSSSSIQTFHKLPFFVPSEYHFRIPDGTIRIYNLNIFQRIFVTLEWHCSCILADIISKVIGLSIILSIISVILSSIDRFQYQPKTCSDPACNNSSLCPDYMICAPISFQLFNTIDLVCVIFFTIDYTLRLGLVSFAPTRLTGIVPFHWEDDEKELAVITNRNPKNEIHYSKLKKFYKYFLSFHSIIDILCIVPFYIALSSNRLSLSFFRCLRLFRFLRLMKLSYKGALVVALLQRTVTRSWEAIVVLTFYLIILVFITGTLAYTFESGTFTVNSDYPKGQFLRISVDQSTVEISPYTSIPTSIYWAIVTATTVGYGDLTPTTTPGRILGCVLSVLGVLVLALPISILGNNFTTEYAEHMKRLVVYEKYMEAKSKQMKKDFKKNLIDAPLKKVKLLTHNHRPSSRNNGEIIDVKNSNENGIVIGIENVNIQPFGDEKLNDNDNTISNNTTEKYKDDPVVVADSDFSYNDDTETKLDNEFNDELNDSKKSSLMETLKRKNSIPSQILSKVTDYLYGTSSNLYTTQDIETQFNTGIIEMNKYETQVDVYNKYQSLGITNMDRSEFSSDLTSTIDSNEENTYLNDIIKLSKEELLNLSPENLVDLLQNCCQLYKKLYYKHTEFKNNIRKLSI